MSNGVGPAGSRGVRNLAKEMTFTDELIGTFDDHRGRSRLAELRFVANGGDGSAGVRGSLQPRAAAVPFSTGWGLPKVRGGFFHYGSSGTYLPVERMVVAWPQ